MRLSSLMSCCCAVLCAVCIVGSLAVVGSIINVCLCVSVCPQCCVQPCSSFHSMFISIDAFSVKVISSHDTSLMY